MRSLEKRGLRMEIDVTAVFEYGTFSNRKGIIAVLALWGETRSLGLQLQEVQNCIWESGVAL